MRKEFLLGLALAFAIGATSVRAEELWVISAGDDFAYFIDAESIVTVPGDIRKASVHQVFFQPRDVGEETPVRVVSIEFDFDCVASTYQQLFGIGIDDLMNHEAISVTQSTGVTKQARTAGSESPSLLLYSFASDSEKH